MAVGLLDQLIQKLTERLEAELASIADAERERTQAPPSARPTATNTPHAHPVPKPTPRANTADSCWVQPGQVVNVHGHLIEGGLVYVGRDLRGVSRYVGKEPSLIDPRLKVSTSDPDTDDRRLYYWYSPGYQEMTPQHRSAYLAWLANGRQDPDALRAYVHLYFYGLERRLLADTAESPQVWAEADTIVAEVERLLHIYGDDYLLRERATGFLNAVGLLRDNGKKYYDAPPPTIRGKWEFPLQLKIGLGQLAVDRKPIPAEWAYAWLKAHPDGRLGTPAERCPEEFEQLFAIRYRERFGEGLVIKPNKKRLSAYHRPASPSFGGSNIQLPVGNLPDISALTLPIRKLSEPAAKCYLDLDPYSRWLGRHPDGKGSLAAIARLPAELAAGSASDEVADLCRWIEGLLGEEELAVFKADELITRWSGPTAEKLPKAESEALAGLLAQHGYGIEPDARLGGGLLASGPAVLFRLDTNSPASPVREYAAATLIVQMAVVVGSARGEVSEQQRRYIRSYLMGIPDLTFSGRQRLTAHLAWRLATGAKLNGIKPRLIALDPDRRPGVGRFLVGVAAAGGFVSPEEITLLEKLYRLLELPPGDVYGHIHALTVAPPAADPVTVRAAGPARSGYSIPPPPSSSREVVLDPSRVEAKIADSAAVSSLLGDIFMDEEDAQPQPGAAAAPSPPDTDGVAGLDAAHSSLLRALAERANWSRGELEALAAERGLLPDGALDTINEAALEAFGEPVCEGDDPIEMNPEALKELFA